MKKSIVASAVFSTLMLFGCGQEENKTVNTEQTSANSAQSVSNGGIEAATQGSIQQSSVTSLTIATQQDIEQLANELVVKYQLLTNIPTDKCDKEKATGACFEVQLSFTAPNAINANGWEIYFSQISPVQSSESDWFDITHINGDLHRISLKDSYNGFAAGETKSLIFRANFWSLSETDALPNYIVTSEIVASEQQRDSINTDIEAKVIASTRAVINPETGLEDLPYVAPYTDVDKHFKRNANDKSEWLTAEKLYERNALALQNVDGAEQSVISSKVIPTPKQIEVNEGEALSLANGVHFVWQNTTAKEMSAAIARLNKLGIQSLPQASSQSVPVQVTVAAAKNSKEGSYQLSVTDTQISIIGSDENGAFNGLQSLASLITIGNTSIPQVAISDEPHYAFRGILVDVSRNFHDKAFILRLLEQMAAYKMNKLHLHLGDDEGWRLEIPSLPELTEVSSKRCFDPSEQRCLLPQLGAGVDPESGVNGYFSVADYQDILIAAKARFIQVIPSLDMPGHSRAAVKAMEARYQKYMALEQPEKANQYRLHDPKDETVYSSVQYYSDNTINVCLESSYAFIETVMKDVKAMHQAVDHPLTRYHIGADETAGAWVESPACHDFLAKHNAEITDAKALGAYFVERVANMLANLDIEAAAWIDGLEHTNPNNMPAVVQANAWHPLAWGGHKSAHKLGNYNWQMVVSSPDVTYFDFPYEADPKEHGYYWAAREINSQKVFNFMPDNLPIHAEFWLDREGNPYVADDTLQKDEQGKVVSAPLKAGNKFLGLQGQLWSENTRTEQTAEYKIYPRLLALAERAWHSPTWAVPYNHDGFKYSHDTNVFTDQHKAERDREWQQFALTLGQKELPKLALDNIHFRLPTVGAVIKSGKLHANIAYPGIGIEFQQAGKNWQPYQAPIAVNGEVKVRAVGLNGQRVGRAFTVNKAVTSSQ